MLRIIGLLVVLAIFCVSADVLDETQNIIRGELTSRSVLIYEGRVNGDRDFEWKGINQISRYEVSTKGKPNPALWTLIFRGGVYEDYLQFWSETRELDVVVRIFAEPQNSNMGAQNTKNVLVKTSHITGETPLNVDITGTFIASYVELIDRSNGTGVQISGVGLQSSNLQLRFRSPLYRAQVDYTVNIYGQQVTPNHHEIGSMKASSVRILSDTITLANLTRGGSFNQRLPNYDLDYTRLTDLTDGTGGRVISSSQYRERLSITFERQPNLRFLLEVYGTSRPQKAARIGNGW